MENQFCSVCPLKVCETTGKLCREVENWLEREQAKDGYSMRRIRRIEIPYDPQDIDWLSGQRAFKLKYGQTPKEESED